MLFANVCAGFISSCYGELWDWHSLGFCASLWCLVHMESASFASLPFCVQGLGYIGVLPAGHALWAEIGGGITFVTFGETAWQLIKLPFSVLGLRLNFGCGSHFCSPLWGRPSLHGSDACMIYWNNGALRRNCRQKFCKTSFSPSRVFLFSRNSRERFLA